MRTICGVGSASGAEPAVFLLCGSRAPLSLLNPAYLPSGLSCTKKLLLLYTFRPRL